MAETSRDKFARLATKRVNTAIKCIQLIGNLSNRSNYDYSSDEVAKIFDALTSEVRKARSRFEQANEKKSKFKL